MKNRNKLQRHRANADVIANKYLNSDFHQYYERISQCASLIAVGEEFKILSSRFCRVRYCPVCQWRRSLMWKSRIYETLPKLEDDFPNYRWLFLTLTIRNCAIADLNSSIRIMNAGFRRLTKLSEFPGVGWLKCLEITRSHNNSAHPHFHCLVMVKPNFFGKGYVKQSRWSELWGKSLRADYLPIVDVRAIKKGEHNMAVPEVVKYSTKPHDLIVDPEWLWELTRQTHNIRAISTGGLLKSYLQKIDYKIQQQEEDKYYFLWNPVSKEYEACLL